MLKRKSRAGKTVLKLTGDKKLSLLPFRAQNERYNEQRRRVQSAIRQPGAGATRTTREAIIFRLVNEKREGAYFIDSLLFTTATCTSLLVLEKSVLH